MVSKAEEITVLTTADLIPDQPYVILGDKAWPLHVVKPLEPDKPYCPEVSTENLHRTIFDFLAGNRGYADMGDGLRLILSGPPIEVKHGNS